jgi:hypothetical protein
MIAPRAFAADEVVNALYAGGRLRKLRFLMTDNSSGRKRHLIPNPELPDEPHESNPEAHAGTNQAQHLGTAQYGDARLIQAGKQRYYPEQRYEQAHQSAVLHVFDLRCTITAEFHMTDILTCLGALTAKDERGILPCAIVGRRSVIFTPSYLFTMRSFGNHTLSER